MSASEVPNALVRLLEERPENWRTLADLAVDFAPPKVARAVGNAMSDPSADPSAVLDAIRSSPDVILDDGPLAIGSIEPETLDFAPVSTITDDVYVHEADIDLDFGAGTYESPEVLDQSFSADETEELDEEMPSTEFDDALTPDRLEAHEDESVLGLDDFDDDEDADDGAHFDVGE